MNFKDFPILKTERLTLRKLKESDWENISYLRSDKIVNQFVKRPNADTKEKAIDFIKEINLKINKSQIIYWSISSRNDQKMIGSICLWNFSKDKKTAEIGYDLNPKYQKTGIMDESMKEVLNFGFQILNLEKIEAFTHKKNESSISLLIKNNFILNENKIDQNNLENIIFEINRPVAKKKR